MPYGQVLEDVQCGETHASIIVGDVSSRQVHLADCIDRYLPPTARTGVKSNRGPKSKNTNGCKE